MVRAYFDTIVLGWIVDGLVPAEDVDALKAAFTRGELIAPIGPVILDELAGGLRVTVTGWSRSSSSAEYAIGNPFSGTGRGLFRGRDDLTLLRDRTGFE